MCLEYSDSKIEAITQKLKNNISVVFVGKDLKVEVVNGNTKKTREKKT